VEVCRRWRSCNLWRRRLCTTTQSLIDLKTDRPVTIPTARGQTWQGRDSCSGLNQLVRSWESLACLQLCGESPVRRWWKPCSYRLAAQWRISWCQGAPPCSAGVCWVVGHLRCLTTLNTFCASSSGCCLGDRLSKHFRKCRNREGHVNLSVFLPVFPWNKIFCVSLEQKMFFIWKQHFFLFSTVQSLCYFLHVFSFPTSLRWAASHCTSTSVNSGCTKFFCYPQLVFLAYLLQWLFGYNFTVTET